MLSYKSLKLSKLWYQQFPERYAQLQVAMSVMQFLHLKVICTYCVTISGVILKDTKGPIQQISRYMSF